MSPGWLDFESKEQTQPSKITLHHVFCLLAMSFILIEVFAELAKRFIVDLGFVPQMLPSYTENKPRNFPTGQVQCLILFKIYRG